MRSNDKQMLIDSLKPRKTFSVFSRKGKASYKLDPKWTAAVTLHPDDSNLAALDRVLDLIITHGELDTATENTLKLVRACLIIRDLQKDVAQFNQMLRSDETEPGAKRFNQTWLDAIKERQGLITAISATHDLPVPHENTLYLLDTYRKYLNMQDE